MNSNASLFAQAHWRIWLIAEAEGGATTADLQTMIQKSR